MADRLTDEQLALVRDRPVFAAVTASSEMAAEFAAELLELRGVAARLLAEPVGTEVPAGYVVGYVDEVATLPVLDGYEGTHADLGDALGELAEATPQDPRVRFAVYALHEMRGDITATASADRAPAERVTVDFEVLLRVFMDGVTTGAATTLQRMKPDASGRLVDDAARAVFEAIAVDPLATEQLREHIRGRLRGEITADSVDVPIWRKRAGE